MKVYQHTETFKEEYEMPRDKHTYFSTMDKAQSHEKAELNAYVTRMDDCDVDMVMSYGTRTSKITEITVL